MNEPLPLHAPAGSSEELRQFIRENVVAVLMHIDHAYDYAEIGSDVALGYALRSASAYLNAAVLTYADLLEKGTCDAS